MYMNLQIQNEVALVTAASKGLGKATALALAREGARLVMCARSEALESSAEEIREETGAEIVTVKGDVTRSSDVERFVQTTVDHW